ncbi:GntR family transcriptional regulator [Leifsonia poae]|uniref:GntR family transcriptional regulator n=1 Tax=Leifsonia poae TaxID=110933 RepID=UPI003D66E611
MTVDKATGTLSFSMQAIDRRLLRNDVYALLLERIITGDFAPGVRLKDSELTEWLMVSRTPVREALSRLAVVGLVKTAPNRFTLVAPLVLGEVADAVGILCRLYPDAVAESRRGLTDDVELELDLIAARLRRDPLLNPVEMVQRVLGVMLGTLRNRVLADTIEAVQLRVLRYLNVSASPSRLLTNERVARLACSLGSRSDDAIDILNEFLEEISVLVAREAAASVR